jgi:hypothetical protein
MRHAFKICVKNLNGERSLQRLKNKQGYNSEIVLGEILCEGVDWICLFHDRVLEI